MEDAEWGAEKERTYRMSQTALHSGWDRQ